MKIHLAIFCIYDIIFTRDIRVEIVFNQKSNKQNITIYSIDEQGQKENPNELEWNCACLSSMLRGFNPQSGPAIRIIDTMSRSHFDHIMKIATNIIESKDFQFGKCEDIILTTMNHLAGKIIDYLLDLSRYIDCQQFIEKLGKPFLAYFCKVQFILNQNKDAILSLIPLIKECPNYGIYLYFQGKGLLNLQMYLEANSIAKFACELCPESTSCWVLLAQTFLYTNQLSLALIALDTAPIYEDDILADGILDKAIEQYEHTKVKKVFMAKYFIARPKYIDMELYKEGVRFEAAKDDEIYSQLSQLSGNKLTESEKLVYQCIILAEKLFSWDHLINCKNETFAKRGCEKLDDFLSSFTEDLGLIKNWEKEEKTDPDQVNKSIGPKLGFSVACWLKGAIN